MTFSQRMGLVKVRDAIQVCSLDAETRAALWNLLLPFINAIEHEYPPGIARSIWTGLYQQPADTTPPMRCGQYEHVSDETLYVRFFRRIVIDGPWNQCLDFVEYVANESRATVWNRSFYDYSTHRQRVTVPTSKRFNAIFKDYMVGYLFVNGQITPITSEVEVKTIEDAVANSPKAVVESLSKALTFLSSRSNPDYAKSVQAAISAVESQCCILLGKDNVTLGAALKQLETKGVTIHAALKEAFNKLYGYTSSADGIRHGSINPSDVDQELAKFMLVSCSAFVNYLIAKQN